MNNKRYYFDNAATTPLLPSVEDAIKDAMEYYGNPSSLYYAEGQIAANLIDNARTKIAECIGCQPEELIFTSCGSESNCQALISTFDYAQIHGLGNNIITSPIEHHSILSACEYLREYRGADITYVGVDEYGRVDPNEVRSYIGANTCLISIMDSNNEIGTIQDVAYLKQVADEHGIMFHSDCVQSFMHRQLDINNYDMFSASGHKIGAPKGIGLLYRKAGTPLLPLIHGTQENGLRGGTTNVLLAVALAEAVKYHTEHMIDNNSNIQDLADYMRMRILSEIPSATLNGHPLIRLQNNLSFTIPGVRGEEVLTMLDMYGIACSTGSACNTSSGEPSHVLKAIGLDDQFANATIRITLSQDTILEDVEYFITKLEEVVNILRGRN